MGRAAQRLEFLHILRRNQPKGALPWEGKKEAFHHKASGQAVVRIAGDDIYLGVLTRLKVTISIVELSLCI